MITKINRSLRQWKNKLKRTQFMVSKRSASNSLLFTFCFLLFTFNLSNPQLFIKQLLTQNQPLKLSTIQTIWRTIQRYFESDSRQLALFRDKARKIFLTPANPKSRPSYPKSSSTVPPILGTAIEGEDD